MVTMFKRQSPVRLKDKAKIKNVRRIIDPNKRMLLRQLLIGFLLFSLIALLVTGVWYGTRIHRLTITTVTISGGETIDHSLVEAAVQTALSGTYAGLIPRRFAWWYPQAAVDSAVRAVPRLKDPVVSRTSGQSQAVTFDEYVPYALWCEGEAKATCLFIDNAGFAFTPAPQLSGGAMIRYRTLGVVPTVGQTLATAAELATMAEFINLVRTELKFEIESVETDTAGDVFYILAGGGEFKAALRTQAPEVFDNLRTILAAPEFNHIKPGNFQYIDLRFGSKVFVNEESLDSATSTPAASVVVGTTTAEVQ